MLHPNEPGLHQGVDGLEDGVATHARDIAQMGQAGKTFASGTCDPHQGAIEGKCRSADTREVCIYKRVVEDEKMVLTLVAGVVWVDRACHHSTPRPIW